MSGENISNNLDTSEMSDSDCRQTERKGNNRSTLRSSLRMLLGAALFVGLIVAVYYTPCVQELCLDLRWQNARSEKEREEVFERLLAVTKDRERANRYVERHIVIFGRCKNQE